MNTLKRSALMPYSVHQMFELVNNVQEYPRFLPWCHGSEIISDTGDEIVASLDIAWKGIHKTLTTRNRITKDERIEITLLNGPAQYLEGVWVFIPLNKHGCKIMLDLEFKVAGGFLDMLIQPIIQHIADGLMDAFCKRAVELYT